MSHFTVLVIGENPEEHLAPFQENNTGDCPKEYMVFEEDDDYDIDDETGKRGHWHNPNSKWDWYSLGGRWSGLIELKEGASGISGRSGVFGNKAGIDQARKGDISNLDSIKTFAVLKDGKWYDRGKMGWFGVVHNEMTDEQWDQEFKSLLNGLPNDTLLSIYDCHI